MPFASYDDLTSTIATFLNRGDLGTAIPDFIRLAEARMQRELRLFATREENTSFAVSATTGQTSALVSGQTPAQISNVRWRIAESVLTKPFNPGMSLPEVSADQLRDWHETNPLTGAPQAYALTGNMFTVYPFPDVPKDSTGADSFYQLMATTIGPNGSFGLPLTAGNFSYNPIITEHPDLYLYGALVEAAPYLMHDERLPMWEARFQQAVRAISAQDERLAFGGRPHRVTLPVVFG